MASSLSPPEVPMELHAVNREKLLDSLRAHLSSSSRPSHGFVLLEGGKEQTRYCTDHEELFRQESYFAYLFGVKEPGFYGAIDVASGESVLFAPRLPAAYAVWLGEIKPLSYFKELYKVNKVFYTDEIVNVLLDLYKGMGNPLLFLLHGLNTDSSNFSKPAEFQTCYHLCAQTKCMKVKGMDSATRKALHNLDYILMKNCTFGKLLSNHFAIRLLFIYLFIFGWNRI